MAISKEQVFFVTGRLHENGIPLGPVIHVVVCSSSEFDVRQLLENEAPDLSVLSVGNLLVMENCVRDIKAALSGKNQDLMVLVDPALQALAAA
jgi:hypothetical protein